MRQELDHAFAQLKPLYPGIARIFAEILSVLFPHHTPYQEFVQETTGTYPISFLNLVSTKEPWEYAVGALERLCDGDALRPMEAERRLVWAIDVPSKKVIGVYDQKRLVRGGWSEGRYSDLWDIKVRSKSFAAATDHDNRVFAAIRDDRSYGHTEQTHANALRALIGHPLVIQASSKMPLELTKGTVTLMVQEVDDSVAFSLSEPCHASGVALRPETESRVCVIDVDDVAVRLQTIIGTENKLQVPKSEKAKIETIVQKLEQKFLVQSCLIDPATLPEAQTTLYIQVVPCKEGLKAHIFVRPFATKGPFFRPGYGLTTPQAMIDGTFQRVRRNLNEERKNADQLIAKIEPLHLNDGGSDEWVFEGPEESLEFLCALKEHPEALNILWPDGQPFSVTSPINSEKLSLHIHKQRDWFSVDGTVTIDDSQVVELKVLLQYLQSNTGRFIPLENKQFLAITDGFRRQLLELQALGGKDGQVTIHPLQSHALADILQGAASVQTDDHWLEARARLETSQTFTPVVPSTLQAELRPYQHEGFLWLSRLCKRGFGACLADDMGLGKTVQALAVMLEHAPLGPTLVVAPASVCTNWVREISRFCPSMHIVFHPNERDPQVVETLGAMQILVTTYGLLNNEAELLSTIPWETAILDEAQSIKNVHTKRSRAALQIQAKTKIVLTGTPLENRLSELWTLFHFINPGLLGSYESFTKRFSDPIELHNDAAAKHALRKLIQPFVLRRLKHQVLDDLPPRIEKTLTIQMDQEERSFHEALRQNALERISQIDKGNKARIHILAEIMRLRRACCHPALVAPELSLKGSKLSRLLELIDELRENKHRALIFSQFVDYLSIVRTELEKRSISFQYLDGSTSIPERQKRVDAFQAGSGDFFLISLRAGGTGLNLTAADYVVHLDPWWNPAVEDQASDRAHRIGQTRTVTIYRMIMEGSIEEKMVQLHQSKRDLANDVLEGADMTGKLSDEELIALMRA